ncbi:MAG TPA: glycosyltransferase family 4 protein [Desulfomonilia bacterium]
MHILFLTDNFPPEVNAPASRTYEHCIEWVKEGCEVTVVTCFPNFPNGKVFSGYKNKLWDIENMNGIRVIRVWTFITPNKGFLKRIIDYQSFMVSAVIASVFVKKPDVVIGTSPQFFTACAAYIVSFFKRKPFIFELRDIWPESIKVVGAMKDSFILNLLEKVEMHLYKKADLIVSVTNSFKRVLMGRGVDGNKIRVVLNGADLSNYKPMQKDEEISSRYGLEGRFVAGYVGTHGMAHALETILEAASKSENRDIRFLMVGDGAQKDHLKEIAAMRNLDNVVFIDTVPKSDIARYYSLLDASIIHLKKTDLFRTVIPSKLFECMAMGIPVIFGVEGESAEIVISEDVGLTFEPENPDDLSRQINRLKDNEILRKELRNKCVHASKKYRRDANASEMLGHILEVAGKG